MEQRCRSRRADADFAASYSHFFAVILHEHYVAASTRTGDSTDAGVCTVRRIHHHTGSTRSKIGGSSGRTDSAVNGKFFGWSRCCHSDGAAVLYRHQRGTGIRKG